MQANIDNQIITQEHTGNTLAQKLKLQQKKARLTMEEVQLKIKERKMRTRHLIEMGGLVAKAELDNLPANSLFGALVSLKDELIKRPGVQDSWTKVGKEIFDQAEKSKTPIILKFESKPEESIRSHIRQHGLKWNALRKEWYGYIIDMQSLKNGLVDLKYELEIVRQTEL